MHISVVSPVYHAERIVDELCSQLISNLEKITSDFEIILVEDGSPDDSWSAIERNCKLDKRVRGIKLSRNFGQQNAILAGLEKTKGDWTVVMDCDLQDRPDELENLYAKTKEGYDIVFARRVQRQDSVFKKMTSAIFHKAFSYFSGDEIDGSIANYGFYSRKVINAINNLNEPYSVFSVTTRFVGFNSTFLDIKHGKRFEGESSYSISALIKFATDYALTYSQKPLKLTIRLGLTISVLSFFYSIYFFISYYLGIIKQPGFTSVIISIWFLSGLIIFTLGVLGLYIGKTFENTKNRPRYLVDLEVN